MSKELLSPLKKFIMFTFKTAVIWNIFHSGTIRADFYGFPIFDLFDAGDYRCRAYAYPFPLIFDYAAGDLSSHRVDYRIVTNTPDTPPADMPPEINELLQNCAQKVHYYEAYASIIPGQSTYNYFLHTTFIPSMQMKDIKFEASVGMFYINNIVVRDTNTNGPKKSSKDNIFLYSDELLPFSYSYHTVKGKNKEENKEYLSGNVARFQIIDLNKPADGWFVAIYQNNAIVVHWFFFIPQEVGTTHKDRQLPSKKEWDAIPVQEILRSTFVPVKTPDHL